MPLYEEEDQKAMAVAIRQVFVNAAVDERLAQSIFQLMFAAHTSIKLSLPPKLNCIRLRVGRAPALNGQMMDGDFKGILDWIGRSWICRRDPRDTRQSDVVIEEVGHDTRLSNGKRLEDDMDEFPMNEEYVDIWKALWPDTRAGWKVEWQSIPLASDADDSTY
jgi:hypothetical protein